MTPELETLAPLSDEDRLAELRELRILDTPTEQPFEDLVALARRIADVPMCYVSFVDDTRVWLKARYGIDSDVFPARTSYCQFVVSENRTIVIPDIQRDRVYAPRIGAADSGSVRSYLGIPIRSASGAAMGTLCVLDAAPRDDYDALVEPLERLARQASSQLELRRANALLLEERDSVSLLFEAAPVPMVLVEHGAIVRANYEFAALVINSEPSMLEHRLVADFFRNAPEHSGTAVETLLFNELGESIPVLALRSTLRAGGHTFDLLAVTDIRERKEKERVLEDARIQAETANRIKDTFLSLVSHDLRSPISGIFTMLDLLATRGSDFSVAERDEAIRELRAAAAVLVEMVNQLLNIHRLREGRLAIEWSEVHVHKQIEQVTMSLMFQLKEKRIQLANLVDPSMMLLADRGLLREAVFNLVSNAVKFSAPGGEIRIRSEKRAIIIEDDGHGVPEEDIPNLFRHEVKTSREGTEGERGTGLGLPLVADIMRAHGGSVFVDENYQSGARFVLDFGTGPSAEEREPVSEADRYATDALS